jgi:hypothetical protein
MAHGLDESNTLYNKGMAEVAGWQLPRMQGCRKLQVASLRNTIKWYRREAKEEDDVAESICQHISRILMSCPCTHIVA